MNDKLFFNVLKRDENVFSVDEVLEKINTSDEFFHVVGVGFRPLDLKEFVNLGSKLIIRRSDYGNPFSNAHLQSHFNAGAENARIIAKGFLSEQLEGGFDSGGKVFFFGTESSDLLGSIFDLIDDWGEQVCICCNKNFKPKKLQKYIDKGASTMILKEHELPKSLIKEFIASGKEKVHIFPEDFDQADIDLYKAEGATIVSKLKSQP